MSESTGTSERAWGHSPGFSGVRAASAFAAGASALPPKEGRDS
jgi:hypothetical protein